jgi:voltage-gated cation channel
MGKGITNPPPGAGLCRMAFVSFVEHPVFETLAVSIIFLNSLAMGFTGPSPLPGSFSDNLSFVVNVTCCILFTVELVLKYAAYGLWHSHGGLLKSSWCILDIIVIGSTWVDLGFFLSTGEGLASVQFMRFLRVLRPLRSVH